MAKSVTTVADDLRDALFSSDLNVITFSWPEFASACDRERLKDAFTNELKGALASRSVSIAYGMASVLVAKDYNFAQGKFKS